MTSNGLIAYPARDPAGHQNIFFIREDGTGRVQKTFGADNGLPSWSPNGDQLAYVSRDPVAKRMFICLMNADGSGQCPIGEGTSPAWSPDGGWIAYSSASNHSIAAEIWIMHPDGSGRRQITHSQSGTRKVLPTWSPDSRKIAYGQIIPTAPPHVSVWIVDVTGANPHPLTIGSWVNLDAAGTVINTANDAGTPSWSPVGDTIVFWSGVENQTGQIWTIKSHGTSRIQLTHDRHNNDDPEFSPDGSKILYSSGINAGTLWVMSSDGANKNQIADNTAGPFPGDASWQPIR